MSHHQYLRCGISKQIMYIITGHYIQTYHTGAQHLVNESNLIRVWGV